MYARIRCLSDYPIKMQDMRTKTTTKARKPKNVWNKSYPCKGSDSKAKVDNLHCLKHALFIRSSIPYKSILTGVSERKRFYLRKALPYVLEMKTILFKVLSGKTILLSLIFYVLFKIRLVLCLDWLILLLLTLGGTTSCSSIYIFYFISDFFLILIFDLNCLES